MDTDLSMYLPAAFSYLQGPLREPDCLLQRMVTSLVLLLGDDNVILGDDNVMRDSDYDDDDGAEEEDGTDDTDDSLLHAALKMQCIGVRVFRLF